MTAVFGGWKDALWFFASVALFLGGGLIATAGLSSKKPFLVVLGLGLGFAGLDLLDGWTEE